MEFSSQVKKQKKSRNCEIIAQIVGILLFVSAFIWTTRLFRADILEALGEKFLLYEIVFFGIVIIGIFWALQYAFKKRWKIEKIFLICYIPCSLLMLCAMPVTRVPDEGAQLIQSYLISSGQFIPQKNIPFFLPENIREGLGGGKLNYQ